MEYLACAYSDKDPTIVDYRYHLVNNLTVKLLNEGHVIFSPITYTHLLSQMPVISNGEITTLPRTREFWVEGIDMQFLRACHTLLIQDNTPWWESPGVYREFQEAVKYGIHIECIWAEINHKVHVTDPRYITDYKMFYSDVHTIQDTFDLFEEERNAKIKN